MKMIVPLLFSLLFFSQVVSAEERERIAQGSIQVNIWKSYEQYSVKKIVRKGKSGYLSHNIYKGKRYYGEIISEDKKILGYFPASEMSIIICWDDFTPNTKDPGGCRELSEGEIHLKVPLIPGGVKAEIYDPQGKKILTIDIPSATSK